jgi:molybdopterin-guanine dinucleotide biosynthesis protein A
MIGAVLAGGAGSRMGGAKAGAELAGRTLISYPLEALGEACDPVAVVCKADTELPDIGAAERWEEPDEPRHPLTGIVHALERAKGPVLVCAVDMPFVTPDAVRTLLAGAGGGDATAAVAMAKGELQPVLGIYSPAALDTLRDAAPDAPLRETVEALGPARVALPPPMLQNVNTPEELAEAERLLSA